MPSHDPEELFTELVRLISEDPRLHDIDVTSQPHQLQIHIGGQSPFWQHHVDSGKLQQGTLRAYADEIVDAWDAQRGHSR